MSTLAMKPIRRPYRIHQLRIWQVTSAVVLAHIAVFWWLGMSWLNQATPAGETEHFIMANMVMEVPAPRASIPQPVERKAQNHTHQQPATQKAATAAPQLQPSPVMTPTPPSEATPSLAAAGSPSSPASSGAQTTRPATPAPVSLPSTDADYLNNPAPPYPRASRRMGEQGTVVLRVFINTEGRAEQAEIRTSSGYTRLDEAALETVKRWRYVPGKRAGVPEPMWFNVPIRFVLD